MYGVLLISFIAQLMISLTRYLLVPPARSVSTKFIISSLQKLTVTLVPTEDGHERRYYSNFGPLNEAVLSLIHGSNVIFTAPGTALRGQSPTVLSNSKMHENSQS